MKTKPMSQQTDALNRLNGERNFALFMEQGTGKTWTILADAERCFLGNKIDALLVIAPNGVHTNWVRREIPEHLEVPYVAYAWDGKPTTRQQKADFEKLYYTTNINATPRLRIFTINFEACRTKVGVEYIEEFMRCFRVMAIVDESKKIGNPKSKQSIQIVKSGKLAEARRILSGKPLTKSPSDLFNQFEFLRPGMLGTTSYRAFVAEYNVLVPPDSPLIQNLIRRVGPKAAFAQITMEDEYGNKMYRNLDKLSDVIAPHMYRVRKDQCLNLPPKVYQQVPFEMGPEQWRVYKQLEKDHAYLSQTEGPLSFEAIAARTKMKQVTSGFINVYGEAELLGPDANPRMETFLDIVENLDGSFIVWSIYRSEIRQIVEELKKMGITSTEYHGGVDAEEREKAIDDFQSGRARAFICNKAAYAGLTLTAARTNIYFSCDFDNDIRSQSEDRSHRIGTTDSVLYIDLVAARTIDEDIIQNLAVKNAIADHVIDRKPLTLP